MTALPLALMAAALLAASAEPRREPATGTRLPSKLESEVDPQRVREVISRYGDCVVRKNADAARYFVLSPEIDDTVRRKYFSKIADSDCVLDATDAWGAEITFPTHTMRYALAEALVRTEFAAGPAPSVEKAAPLVQPQLDESDYQPEPGKVAKKRELERLNQYRDQQLARIYLANFGECVVRADPLQSYKLLMAKTGSPEEQKAFGSLMPALSSCMSAGRTLELNKATVRGTVAMNYYRLAHAPRADITSAGATK